MKISKDTKNRVVSTVGQLLDDNSTNHIVSPLIQSTIRSDADNDDLDWITINGAHVPLDPDTKEAKGGLGGKAAGKTFSKAKGSKSSGAGEKNSSTPSGKSSSSKNGNSTVKAEPYTGKRSGDKALDKQFDNTRQAYAEWKAAEADEEKALKNVAKKNGLIKNTRGSVSYQDRAKIRALKDPDLVSAEKATQKAMNKHIRETGKLKDLYSSYRKNGGEQIREYYSAASEWDDND